MNQSEKLVRSGTRAVHRDVRAHLLAQITSGEFKLGNQIPSEPEIAQQLGVSRMTANRAINDLRDAGFLSRQRGKGTFVIATSPEAETVQVAVVLNVDVEPAYDDSYFGTLFWGLHDQANRRNSRMRLLRFEAGIESNPHILSAAGVIAINPEEGQLDDLKRIRRSGRPVVLLGSDWPGSHISSVDSENRLGASLAVNHLADRGYTEIMFVGGYPESANTLDRLHGYRFSMKSRGLAFSEDHHIFMSPTPRLAPKMLTDITEVVSKSEQPWGIFAGGPLLAMQLERGLTACGLTVPKDVALVAYDDPTFLTLVTPALTTIRQPLFHMAQAALDLLHQQIESGDPREHHIVLDPTLVVRGSTAPPVPFLF